MKTRTITTFLLTCILGLTAIAEATAGEHFMWGNLEFEVTSEADKTCHVTFCSAVAAGNIIIPEVVQGYKVTGIDTEAFYGCNQITGITIPTGVESIGDRPFVGCTAIQTVNYNAINAAFSPLSEPMFNGCPIETVNFGENVKTIPRMFIKDSPLITSVVFPDMVDSIGSQAFIECNGIKTITLGANVKAFYNIFNRTVPSGEYGSALEPAALEHIYISDNNPHITIIDDVIYTKDMSTINYFPYYRSNEVYNVPTELKSLGVISLRGYRHLRIVNITHDVEIPFWDAAHNLLSPFGQFSNIAEVNITNHSKYTSNKGIIYTRDMKALVYYPPCSRFTSFTVPNTVEEIYPYAIAHSSNLETLVIPDNVTIIGENAFYNSSSLTSATIGNGITVLPRSCFSSCKALTNVILPNNLQLISANAFNNCSALSKINLPASLKSIGRRALYSTKLQTVTLPKGLLSIGGEAFASTQLQAAVIPQSVIYVGENPFKNTPWLSNTGNDIISNHVLLQKSMPATTTTVTIPQGIRIIAGGALNNSYSNYSNMTGVELPGTVEAIGRNAFYNNSNWYQNLNYFNGLYYLDYVLYSVKWGYENYTIKEGTKCIAGRAFRNNPDLASVTLPVGLVTIGEDAFAGTRIKNINVPEGVRYIGYDAFMYCDELKKVYTPSTLEIIDDFAFESNGNSELREFHCAAVTPPLLSNCAFYYGGGMGDMRENCTLYVPKASIELYRNTDGWKQFKFILPEGEPLQAGDVDGSGIVDVDDVNAMINVILLFDQYRDKYPGNADLDGNGLVDVDDVNALINIILAQ